MATKSYSLLNKGLSLGAHNITVVAKGAGYADSLPSDPVTYTVAEPSSDPSIHELNIQWGTSKQDFENYCGGLPSITPNKTGTDLVQSAGFEDLVPYNLDEQGQDEILINSYAYLQQNASIHERTANEGYIEINGTKYYGTNSDAPNLYREGAVVNFVLGLQSSDLAIAPIGLVLTYNDTLSFSITGGPEGDLQYENLELDTWEQFVEAYPEFEIDSNNHIVTDDNTHAIYAIHYSGSDVSTVGNFVMKTDKLKNGYVYWLAENS